MPDDPIKPTDLTDLHDGETEPSVGAAMPWSWREADVLSPPEIAAPEEDVLLVSYSVPKTRVKIQFSGVFQVRLATDSDPSNHPTGKKGWTFVHSGEPDFDRIIRFSAPVAPRLGADPVGVTVSDVLINGVPTSDALVGKGVVLGAGAFFNGRRHSAGFEPIENFAIFVLGGVFAAGGPYIAGQALQNPAGLGVKSGLMTKAARHAAFNAWKSARIALLQADTDSALSAASTGGAVDPVRIARNTERIGKIVALSPPTFSLRMDAMNYQAQYAGKVDKNLALLPFDSAVVGAMSVAGVTSLNFEAVFSNFDADGLVGKVRGSLNASY